MKAIVTGSNGFIGYNLCATLAAENWEVMGIDDLSGGLASNKVPGIRYEHYQIQNKERFCAQLREFKPDAIFHLAAIPRVSYSVENPFKTAEAIIMGTLSVLEGVVNAGLTDTTRILSTSSSSVYGGAKVMPTPETLPCAPKSPYALQKYQAEEWCRMFASLYGVNVACLRYFNVFGAHSLFGGAYSTVLSAWMYNLYVDNTYEPFLEGDGTQSRDFCYVENVVRANIQAATASTSFAGNPFNIAQGSSTTLIEVKALLEEISGRELPLTIKPPRTGDVDHTLADISAAQKAFGYNPTTNFREQVQVMAEWYQTSYPKKS